MKFENIVLAPLPLSVVACCGCLEVLGWLEIKPENSESEEVQEFTFNYSNTKQIAGNRVMVYIDSP